MEQSNAIGRRKLLLMGTTLASMALFAGCGAPVVAPRPEVPPQVTEARAGPLAGALVLVDPGHGGLDSGAIRRRIEEKQINLSVALLLAEQLEQAGATVRLTRHTDIEPGVRADARRYRDGLRARRGMALQTRRGVVLSIHCNDVDAPVARGPAVFYHRGSAVSLPLARMVATQLARLAGRRCPVLANSQLVLSATEVPSINVEMGFLSNAADLRRLIDSAYQREVAAAVCAGVIAYWQTRSHTRGTSTARRRPDTGRTGTAIPDAPP